MKNAIEVRGLRKHYGSRSVLRGVDLTIPRGEIFALLGVNGAGKTTTLECMEGLKTYDGGTIALDGRTRHSASDRFSAGTHETHGGGQAL